MIVQTLAVHIWSTCILLYMFTVLGVLLSLVYCVFCFYPMRFLGRSVDNAVIAKK